MIPLGLTLGFLSVTQLGDRGGGELPAAYNSKKENFLFNINNSILKKLSIAKRAYSAKIQCTNVTLARKL